MNIKYSEMTIHYTPSKAYLSGCDRDIETTPSKATATIDATSRSLSELVAVTELAAARIVAASVTGETIQIGPNSAIRFSGRTVGQGTTVEWLEATLRVDRDEYGEKMPIAHMRGMLTQHASEHPAVQQAMDFFEAIAGPLVGAGDPQTAERGNLDRKVLASSLMYLLVKNSFSDKK